ncbi:MarR family winged helix-turn-helix transcriptional regulator [Streptomyces sp. NPDC004111]|uniref:MarR family winged helix-turn-helix transcriptional regulator n=1 Tax=Streptomyces sp. NPDC004111 TaxID=3364690 RepID=UPI0036CECA43
MKKHETADGRPAGDGPPTRDDEPDTGGPDTDGPDTSGRDTGGPDTGVLDAIGALDADALLDAVGQAFGKLRRSSLLEVANPFCPKDLSRTLVLNIVLEAEKATLAERATSAEGATPADRSTPQPRTARAAGPGPCEVTVGAVATYLNVDPSVASRMVSDCISAGYLIRAASQQDGRRTVLHLSPEGRELMVRFRRHQRDAFEYVTAAWPERDRLEFARLMLRYVADQNALATRGNQRASEG